MFLREVGSVCQSALAMVQQASITPVVLVNRDDVLKEA